MRRPRSGLSAISERSDTAVKGLTLAPHDAMTPWWPLVRAPRRGAGGIGARRGHREASHDQEDRRRPHAPAGEAGNPARGWWPRRERQSWLRQSARLSRLDRAVSDRRGFSRAPRALPLWPTRDADLGGT